MNQILLTKILPRTLTFSALWLLLFSHGKSEMWLLSAVGLLVLDVMIFVLMLFWRSRSIGFTSEAVIVCGIKIPRDDIQSWQVFRAWTDGEPRRHIELQLEKAPISSIGWWLVELFEPVSVFGGLGRGALLSSEPRIVVALKSWDLTTGEISEAFNSSKSGHRE
ncbi:MAG: hypothetical protein ACRCXD_18195 [Luteolibacter sp.]